MYAIGIYHPKHQVNIGTLWRSAFHFGASLLVVIGNEKIKKQASDTLGAMYQLPLVHYADWEGFMANRPFSMPLVAVELDERSVPLVTFNHPPRAFYLLGAEDNGLPPKVLNDVQYIVQIPGGCLNVSVAGSIVLYDRILKAEL